MNTTYSLKYCPIRQTVIVVSELAKRCKKNASRRSKILKSLIAATLLLPVLAHAGAVRDDINYQIVRDFAENKGQFKAGATDITILKKDGSLLGVFPAPMPDWSFANLSGVTALINPQYISTAAHTKGKHARLNQYGGSGKNPDYHRHTYESVKYSDDVNYDYSAHRLDKLVTDVVPVDYIDAPRTEMQLMDSNRYPVFARIGNGVQRVISPDGTSIAVSAERQYLTGGFFGSPSSLATGGWAGPTIYYSGGTEQGFAFTMFPDKIPNLGFSGDSGSPLIVWDNVDQKWYLVGQYYGHSWSAGRWMIPNAALIQQSMNEDNLPQFATTSGATVNWNYNTDTASGTLTMNAETLNMTGASGTDIAGRNNGKNLTFVGSDATIVLHNSVNQGAGSITFDGNYIVKSENNETWMGAGLDIKENKQVTWQVNGVKDDSLHKIGKGTLIVNAIGKNEGNLSSGDGTIILNQQADASGNKQAFNTIDIVSGRSTVVLGDSAQVNPDNIYFGYRGGRLDLNGNGLTFQRIRNVDTGAQIVNHNKTLTAHVEITGQSTAANQTFMGTIGETDKTKNNGKMSFTFNPLNTGSLLAVTGGSNLDGELMVTNAGTMLLSGRPVQHAGSGYKTGNQINEGEDWDRSFFNVRAIDVDTNSSLQIGEFTTVNGLDNSDRTEMLLYGNASAVLGYHNDSDNRLNSSRCYLDDDTGQTNCTKPNLPINTGSINHNSVAIVNANIDLYDNNNTLQLGHVNLNGTITDYGTSAVKMDHNAYWKVAGNSKLSQAMISGASVDLGSDVSTSKWQPKLLEIDNLVSESSYFTLGVDASSQNVKTDTIVINKSHSGQPNTLTIFGKQGSSNNNIPHTGVTLVTAPAGTTHNAFVFSGTSIGFSSISPLVNVTDDQSDGNKVKWLLSHNASSQQVSNIRSLMMSAGITDQGYLDSAGWMNASDNTSLIDHTKALLETRQFAAAETITHLTDRTTDLRSGTEESGVWGTIRQDKGSHASRSFYQTSITVGTDRTDGISTTGIMANLNQGHDSGPDGREKHTQAGVGIYNSLGGDEGLFLDSALSYQLYHQKMNFAPQMGNLPDTSNSNMLLISSRLGYTLRSHDHDAFIAPIVGLDAGYLDDYTFTDDVVTLQQKASYPVNAVLGFRVGKRWTQTEDKGMTLSAGVVRQQTIHSASNLTLSDAYKHREYDAQDDNRYRFDVGIQGDLSKNLSGNVRMASSTGNNFSTDYSGHIGISYSF